VRYPLDGIAELAVLHRDTCSCGARLRCEAAITVGGESYRCEKAPHPRAEHRVQDTPLGLVRWDAE
jgi:hypothetical protein